MTTAIRKLPPSLMRLAASAFSDTAKVLCEMALRSGIAVCNASGAPGGNDVELTSGGDVGAPEDRCRKVTLPGFGVGCG